MGTVNLVITNVDKFYFSGRFISNKHISYTQHFFTFGNQLTLIAYFEAPIPLFIITFHCCEFTYAMRSVMPIGYLGAGVYLLHASPTILTIDGALEYPLKFE